MQEVALFHDPEAKQSDCNIDKETESALGHHF
jgi:hypothetical protein